MLTLRPDQIESLAAVLQEQVVRQIGGHLEALYPLAFPGYRREFTSAVAQAHLRNEMRLLLERGFASAFEIAAALELFNIFGLDVRSEPVRRTLDDSTLTAVEKLNLLNRLAGFVEGL